MTPLYRVEQKMIHAEASKEDGPRFFVNEKDARAESGYTSVRQNTLKTSMNY